LFDSRPQGRNLFQRLLIIADDLTGACDAAGTMTRYGRVEVSLNGRPPAARIAAVDLNTRGLTRSVARRRVAVVARAAAPQVFLYKKVDSQLRGNVAAEVGAVAAAGRAPLLLVPALPEEGRTTQGGVHRVGKRRIVLHRLLGSVAPSVVVGDARSRADLRRWARRLRALSFTAAAGSAGLAAELPRAFGWRRRAARVHWRPAHAILVAMGSTDARARQQLEALALDRRRPVRTPAATAAVASDLREGLALVRGRAGSLARLVACLQPRPDALVLSGAETARAVLVRAGAERLRLHAEVLPRIPVAAVLGGRLSGVRVVTKAGSFGPREAFVHAVAALERGHA